MNAAILLIAAVAVFIVAYIFYGRWLARKWGIDPARPTPAVEINDGVDYIPSKSYILLGHHFSSIAGAGPINGPIQAAVFGWLPVSLWIIIGGIFFGGPHDMGSLFYSVRNKGKSFFAKSDQFLGKRSKAILMIFFYFNAILLIAAFVSIVANTFVAGNDSGAVVFADHGPQVASISMCFIPAALILGQYINRYRPSAISTFLVGISLLIVALLVGYNLPIDLSYDAWVTIIFLYVIVASVLPVWILLQPRDFLSSFLLYGTMLFSFIGIIFAGPDLRLPAFISFNTDLGLLFPALFITVACGAVSGFHTIVSTGTTSKQIESEADIQKIGYGGMLIESVLAIIALIAVATLFSNNDFTQYTPLTIFAAGITSMFGTLGFTDNLDMIFCILMLAVSAFVLTSLDTCTRIGRYLVQEFAVNSDWKICKYIRKPLFATLITVALAFSLSIIGYQSLWSIFGTLNQLMAAFALLLISSWLSYQGREHKMLAIPTIFMFVTTIIMLIYLVFEKTNILLTSGFDSSNLVILVISVALLIGAVIVINDELNFIWSNRKNKSVEKV